MIDVLSLIGIAVEIFVLCFLLLIYRKLQGISRRIDIAKQGETHKSSLEEKIDSIFKYSEMKETIRDLGRFSGTYVQFLSDVERELHELKGGRVRGPEYYVRQRLVEFALAMALVYARVEGDVERIPKIEGYWKMAKEIR